MCCVIMRMSLQVPEWIELNCSWKLQLNHNSTIHLTSWFLWILSEKGRFMHTRNYLGEWNIAYLSNHAIHLLTLQNYFFCTAFTFSLNMLKEVLSQLENLLGVYSSVSSLSEQCTHSLLKYLFSCFQILD